MLRGLPIYASLAEDSICKDVCGGPFRIGEGYFNSLLFLNENCSRICVKNVRDVRGEALILTTSRRVGQAPELPLRHV